MKKKGSALVIAIFVLTIVSMLILGSYKEVVSRNTEIQDNIQANHDENVRDNGLEILKHELNTIKKYQNQRGIFFKKGSTYVGNTPKLINLDEINYEKDSNNNYKPKSGKAYSGMVINSFYDYIGKTLNTSVNPGKLPWYATKLYIDESNSQITDTSNGGKNTRIKWVYQKNNIGERRDNLVSLVSQIKPITKSADFKGTSIGGYKMQKIENLTKGDIYNISNDINTYKKPNDGDIVKITYIKKIVVIEENSQGDKSQGDKSQGDNFTIQMTVQGEFKDGDFIEDNLVEDKNITRTAKIIREN